MTSVAADQAAGITVTQKSWPERSSEQDEVTLLEMARRIADGIRAPSIRALAGQILRDAGFPADARGKVDALRRYYLKTAKYEPDPILTEFIADAKTSLCTPDAKLCIPIYDCDDGTVAVLSMTGAIGIDVYILALDYGPNIQKHVLGLFVTETGQRLTVDVSPPYPPIGYMPSSAKKMIIDPLDPKIVPTDSPNGVFVGVGATAPTAIPYQSVTTPATAHTGLRYRLGMVLTFTADPTDSYRAAQETRNYFEQRGWTIETLDPQGPAQSIPSAGFVQNWLLQGIATQEIDLTDNGQVQYVAVGVQAASGTGTTAPSTAITPIPNLPSPGLSFAAGAGVAVGLGAVVGLGVYLYRRSRR